MEIGFSLLAMACNCRDEGCGAFRCITGHHSLETLQLARSFRATNSRGIDLMMGGRAHRASAVPLQSIRRRAPSPVERWHPSAVVESRPGCVGYQDRRSEP